MQEARYATDRLTVAPWSTPLSAAELKELDDILDTEVTAFLPPHLLYDPGTSDVSKWASTFSAGESAVSSVRLLGTNELCGLILLRPEKSSVHLGYIFGKRHWGKGLATELLRGLMDQLTVERHVGRSTRQHRRRAREENNLTYDVAYVLGGLETGIHYAYVVLDGAFGYTTTQRKRQASPAANSKSNKKKKSFDPIGKEERPEEARKNESKSENKGACKYITGCCLKITGTLCSSLSHRSGD